MTDDDSSCFNDVGFISGDGLYDAKLLCCVQREVSEYRPNDEENFHLGQGLSNAISFTCKINIIIKFPFVFKFDNKVL